MKKKIATLLCLLSMVALLAACGNTESSNPGGAEKPPVSDSSAPEKEQLEQYAALIGKPEQGLIDLLGKGKETEAEGFGIVSREYEITLFEKKFPLQATIDLGNVLSISIPLEGETYEDWVEKFNAMLGEADQQSGLELEEGSDSVSTSWSLSEATVTLQRAYGSLHLSITPAS